MQVIPRVAMFPRSLLPMVWAVASAIAQDGPQCTVQTLDGRVLQGVVTADASTVTVRPTGGDAVTLQVADLVSIEQAKAGDLPTGKHIVWLRSGLELPASAVTGVAPAGGKPAQLAITLTSGVQIAVPLTNVQALRLQHQTVPVPPTFSRDFASPQNTVDYLFVVSNGKPQRFSVTVDHLAADRVHFDLRGENREFGFDGLAAIVFGKNTGVVPDRQSKPRVAATFATGERLEGRLLALTQVVRVRLDEGVEVELPRDKLLNLSVASDKLTWLSDLQPKTEQTPAFDRAWPWTADRSPAGPGIMLAGTEHRRGLVMVPRTRLTYDLAGRYDMFETTIGIDERGGPQAHAIFRVFVDDKLAFESEPMTLGTGARPLKIPLGKCKTLVLEADFGKNFDLGDLCAFADARVLQQ
ncbi:MAG: NPCBM/NEW2 domain-containing protein [Planctomycetes bacterium]|nr:NPCBM/NEW2 domain-containing protein [Planctomycetota bacterium]